MLHKFSAWTQLSNFDQSKHKNRTNSVTNAWSWWAKPKATVCPACNSWLNFRVRDQFEIKILIVRQKYTTYFIQIKKEIKLEHAIIRKLVTCQRITSKILDLDGSTAELAIRSSGTGQRISYFDSCQLITTLMSNRKYGIEHWSRSSKTNGQRTASK